MFLLLKLLKGPKTFQRWWEQFPLHLRLITKVRLFASIGAGGVIYFSPLIFNQINFSATQIGSGLALAALVGTFSRFITGIYLDTGVSYSSPVRTAAVIAILGDFWLFFSHSFSTYLQGQLLIGIAAGIYWPSIELSVPSTCLNIASSKGFALARSADALGVSIGALIGAIAASAGLIRLVYVIDTSCMFFLIALLLNKPLLKKDYLILLANKNTKKVRILPGNKVLKNLLPKLIPIISLSVLATSIFSLLQSALPLDLVIGGLFRPAISEASSGTLIASQLTFLVILQWPIGSWLANKKLEFGLKLSIFNFGLGCLLLAISNIYKYGVFLAFIAQIPMAIGLASFLPTATETVIQLSPYESRGIAMAIYSQCFAISAFIAPIMAGFIIDNQGNALLLWVTVGITCFVSIPLIKGFSNRN